MSLIDTIRRVPTPVRGRTDDKTKYHLLGLDTLVIYILYPIYKIVNPFFAKFKTEAKESLLLYNLIISLISLYR